MNNQYYQEFLFRIADTTLILSQRLTEWCGHGPVLEEDLALSNTALDYIGQSTNVYKHIAALENKGRDEDQLAFMRDVADFRNLLITELPKGDYGFTVARQYFFSAYYHLFLQELMHSNDEFLKAFAEKSIKEVSYHLKHSSDWVLRLGDGTEESHRRMQQAVNEIWEYTGEFFEMDATDLAAASEGWGVNVSKLRSAWESQVALLLTEATLQVPAGSEFYQSGSKKGRHTEHLGHILSEMQFLQRAYPGAKW
jgi:ring-1,2-phenylacetyl-CoA epoxidase subunit PaaC